MKLHRKLQWTEPQPIGTSPVETKTVPSFSGAFFLLENDFLPNYYETFSVNAEGTADVHITNPVYEPLALKGQIIQSEKIQAEIKIIAQSGVVKKKPVASVSFIPLRKNPATGEIEKLIEFDLEVQVSAGQSGSFAYKQIPSYADQSVLNSGTWYKISVAEDGIYKLDYNFLKTLGIDIDNIDPRNIRLFGNGGGMLPEPNSTFRRDDLMENAIYVAGESDGSFDPNDYVLFYGQGPHRWKYDSASQRFRHQTHLYSDITCYFINTDASSKKRWLQQPSQSNPFATVTSFDDYDFHELEESNIIASGRGWYGEYFNFSVSSYSFNFNFPNLVTSVPVALRSSIVGRSTTQTNYFSVTANGQSVNQHSILKVGTYYTDTFAREDTKENTFTGNSSQINVTVTFTNPSSSSEGWLNFIELNARRNLVYNGTPLFFRDKNSIGTGNKAEFVLQNVPASVKILDITDPVNAFLQEFSLSGNEARFTVATDTLREFVAFVDGSGLSAASAIGTVANQNLHAIGQPDMLIVAAPSLLNEANALAAHHSTDNLFVEVVNVQHIFNEFSSGVQDITAIRDFIRMIYNRAGSDTSLFPQYLLLFGDGSYDYKERLSNNTNLVPTYQSVSSLEPTQTFVTDDYFGFLDENEGSAIIGGADKLDIAIGRLPVNTPEEGQAMVNKIIHYTSIESGVASVPGCAPILDQSASVFGSWRNELCFIGDDEDGITHEEDANQLSAYFESNHPKYNVDKLILDAYPQQTTPGGNRYPDVNEAINRKIFSGTLIMNYTGHGGVNGWAHERILDISSINAWNNFDKMPLFITATCEFSKFDDPGKVSAGEMVLLNPNGGAIGMVTTTRLVYSGANYTMNNNFLQQAFTPLNNRMPTIGEAIMRTKNVIGSTDNNRKFVLLGDPAVMLAYPKHEVVTTEINAAGIADDTLQALKKITVKGEVRNNGAKMADFNGIVYPTIFDKPVRVIALRNDPASGSFSFDLQRSIIYSGKASVTNGDFTFTFIVPKDIAYNMGQGKISYYSDNGEVDANGYSFAVIGGTASDFVADNAGPELDVFMNDDKFVLGGTTNENPLLLVKLNDFSGINTVGTGIGHDITAVLDENSQKTFVLNEYYKADLDNYQAGKVEYPLANLENGRHAIKVKAWDVFNNSSEGYTEFIVADCADLALSHVLNYPNPFTTNTRFSFEHNHPGEALFVTVKIMTVSGKVVKTLAQEVVSTGFRVDDLTWDGLDEYGETIGRGVYVYKLNVRTPDGTSAHEFEKLVILR